MNILDYVNFNTDVCLHININIDIDKIDCNIFISLGADVTTVKYVGGAVGGLVLFLIITCVLSCCCTKKNGLQPVG